MQPQGTHHPPLSPLSVNHHQDMLNEGLDRCAGGSMACSGMKTPPWDHLSDSDIPAHQSRCQEITLVPPALAPEDGFREGGFVRGKVDLFCTAEVRG